MRAWKTSPGWSVFSELELQGKFVQVPKYVVNARKAGDRTSSSRAYNCTPPPRLAAWRSVRASRHACLHCPHFQPARVWSKTCVCAAWNDKRSKHSASCLARLIECPRRAHVVLSGIPSMTVDINRGDCGQRTWILNPTVSAWSDLNYI